MTPAHIFQAVYWRHIAEFSQGVRINLASDQPYHEQLRAWLLADELGTL